MLSRRDFLKLSGLSLLSLAWRPWSPDPAEIDRPEMEYLRPVARGRVTTRGIYVYKEPDLSSERLGMRKRDEILDILEVIRSPNGPKHNPRWYRLANGFVHSAYLQRVENAHVNLPLPYVPKEGRLGEITAPIVQSMRWTRTYGWVPLYRLYYKSVFWITSLDEGPDGKPWYGLTDDLLHVKYHIPARAVRPVSSMEVSPIATEVPPEEKHIEVSISRQTLTAYEGDQVVLQTKVSTGIPSSGPTPNGIPTATPDGHFHIEVKAPSRHMGDGNLTDDLDAYELPGVPWVSFFHLTGVAFHGTYWHNNFGRMMSHGCVNMRNQDAKWLYRWSLPVIEPRDWHRKGRGTYVRVA
jgi:hypothetical protein